MIRKSLFLVLIFSFIFASAVSAHSGTIGDGNLGEGNLQNQNLDKELTVLVNGVEVSSPSNHIIQGKTYVSIEAFADLFYKDFELNKESATVSFNGETLNTKMIHDTPVAWIKDLAKAVNASHVSWDAEYQDIYVLVLPEGVIQLEGGFVIPAMGEHWANPTLLPTGPIFGVHHNKLVFIEYMISQEDFMNGENHRNLQGIEGIPNPPIVQTDIEFQPEGHPGFEVPHFDIHAYYISDEEQQAIK